MEKLSPDELECKQMILPKACIGEMKTIHGSVNPHKKN